MNRKSGGITVFLSLVLLLIMALLGTMVEVARGKICRVHGRRTLRVAVDSLMTEYSRPLYDRYHLFFLEDVGKPFEEAIGEYAADILNPPPPGGTYLDLYDGALASVEVSGKRYAGDENGAGMLAQIKEYMKRQLAEDLLQEGLRRFDGSERAGEFAEQIDEKVEEERKQAKLGLDTLELMRLIDGVNCRAGGVTGEDSFMKMFCTGTKRPEQLAITEPVVWEAIRNKVVSVEDALGGIRTAAGRTRFLRRVEQAASAIRRAKELMVGMGSGLSSLNLGADPLSVLDGNQAVLQRTKELLSSDVTEETISELSELWKNYDTTGISFQYQGVSEEGGERNPLEHFSEEVSGGVQKLVMERGVHISSRTLAEADKYSHLNGVDSEEPDYGKAVHDFAGEQTLQMGSLLGGISEISPSDYRLAEYMKRNFSRWDHPVGQDSSTLKYELEYLACGNRSDKENLEQVINRLFWFRTAVNVTAVSASSGRRQEAYAAALGAVGFTGIDALVRFTQIVILVVWGMVEALVDVAGLLKGKNVPLIKGEQDLHVQFTELFRFGNSLVMEKAGRLPESGRHSFGYEDYLSCFILANSRSLSCFRMMDLMESNIRKGGVEHFDFGMCVDSFEAAANFTYPTKLFQSRFVQDALERRLYEFHSGITVRASYLAG